MTKVTTLAEAVASIPSGAHVALSGFATARCAMAFAHELIRQGNQSIDGFPMRGRHRSGYADWCGSCRTDCVRRRLSRAFRPTLVYMPGN